jgi:hypothetical protein
VTCSWTQRTTQLPSLQRIYSDFGNCVAKPTRVCAPNASQFMGFHAKGIRENRSLRHVRDAIQSVHFVKQAEATRATFRESIFKLFPFQQIRWNGERSPPFHQAFCAGGVAVIEGHHTTTKVNCAEILAAKLPSPE